MHTHRPTSWQAKVLTSSDSSNVDVENPVFLWFIIVWYTDFKWFSKLSLGHVGWMWGTTKYVGHFYVAKCAELTEDCTSHLQGSHTTQQSANNNNNNNNNNNSNSKRNRKRKEKALHVVECRSPSSCSSSFWFSVDTTIGLLPFPTYLPYLLLTSTFSLYNHWFTYSSYLLFLLTFNINFQLIQSIGLLILPTYSSYSLLTSTFSWYNH